MFQIKNLNSIVASMVNNANLLSSELTDFNIGSKNRTILESVAREVDQFYQYLLKGLYEAIPVAIYKSFSFSRLGAQGASGHVTFTRDPAGTGPVAIPAGTSVRVPNSDVIFQTSALATIQEGEDTATVYVVTNTVGVAGNAAAGTVTELVNGVTGVISVTNEIGFSSGADIEGDHDRKIRFQQWVNNLSRATRRAIEYGAKTAVLVDENGSITERVLKCVVHEPCVDDNPPGPPGYINVLIWNGSSGGSAALCTETSKIIYGYTDENGIRVAGWKGAGVIATVLPVQSEVLNIAVDIRGSSSFVFDDLVADVEETIDIMFQNFEIGESFIISSLIDKIMSVPGIVDVKVTFPVENFIPDWKKIITKGVITVGSLY